MRSPSTLAGSPQSLPAAVLYASAAIVGAAVLVVELVGTRLLAPWVGQSHYVWTAQISVTLSALAAGYALGGRWSRQGRGLATLYLALGAAGASLCVAVLAAPWVAARTSTLSLGLSTLITSTTLFFVPLTLRCQQRQRHDVVLRAADAAGNARTPDGRLARSGRRRAWLGRTAARKAPRGEHRWQHRWRAALGADPHSL